MNFLKNSQVSRLYGVHASTVTNWIDSALQKRNRLQLVEEGGKSRILDTANNHLIMKELSEKGRKHKTREHYRELTPTKDFYEIFNEHQLGDIITSLETYREIPHKYTYLNGGAKYWQQYAQRSFEENISNTVTNTKQMLNNSLDFLVSLADEDVKFNVFDIGPGDGSPVVRFLEGLLSQNRLAKYTAIDISSEMLDIAETGLRGKLPTNFNFQRHLADISSNSLKDILFNSTRNTDRKTESRNLVLFVGSTIENQIDYPKTLYNLRDDLSKDDILIIGETLDSEVAKLYFDFSENSRQIESLQERWIPEIIEITEEFYQTEAVYDQSDNTRKMILRLNTDLSVNFEYSGIKTAVDFHKGEGIVVWRHKHHSIQEIVDNYTKAGLNIKAIITSKDTAQALVICELKQ